MILLDFAAEKVQNTLSMLLSQGEKGKRSDAFAALLHELSLSLKEEGADAKNGRLLRNREGDATPPGRGVIVSAEALPTAASVDTAPEGGGNVLAALTAEEEAEIGMLHPNIRNRLSGAELRELIESAKSRLREQIRQVASPEALPTTLRGLLELAEKSGIDIRKITVETLVPRQSAASQPQAVASRAKLEPHQPLFSLNTGETAPTRPQEHTTAELVRTKTAEQTMQKQPPQEHAPLRSLLQEQGRAAATEPATAPSEVRPSPETALPGRVQSAPTELSETLRVATARSEGGAEERIIRQSARSESAPEPALTELPAEAELPKEQGKTRRSRDAAHSPNTPSPAPLAVDGELQAERPLSAALPDDGEAAPAADEAPAANGDKTAPKGSGEISAAGSDGKLELKISEAKQMVRHLAAEVRETVQNYKPPFTRVKIRLNPARLGEVDLTVVQRGNSLHINISSNATAVNTLAQNASELRTQLAQNGMGNATMQFSSNAGQHQQQQHHPRQHAAEQYEAFGNTESFDLLEQLEIIIPHYA